MENLTPAGIWTAVLAVASAIVLLANAAEKIGKAIQIAKAPNTQQNDRLAALEKWKESVDKRLENGEHHFRAVDESNRVTQVALLALLDHGIDGNNITQMQHAKEELQNHLINK